MIRYTVVKFKFDTAGFAEVLSKQDDSTLSIIAKLLGITRSGVDHWIRQDMKAEFAHPRMSNFIATCNWLDLDPRQFFILEDE